MNKKLALILLAVIGLIVLSRYLNAPKEQRSFDADMVKIDSAAVTAVSLYPKSEDGTEIRFKKQEDGWTVRREGITAEADQSAVRTLLASIMDIKADRLVGKDPKRWGDFGVADSATTRVKVEQNGTAALDLLVGSFNFRENVENSFSYFRLNGEDETWSTRGLLSIGFDRKFSSWRNRTVVQLDPQLISRVAFNYPADSSFTIARSEGQWQSSGAEVDSAGVAGYVNGLRAIMKTDFVDNPGALPITPEITATITSEAGDIVVKAFDMGVDRPLLLQSSQNPDAFFASDSTRTFPRLFPARSLLLKSE